MNWKNRLTNYNFWVSIVSAVLLILQALKIKVDFIYVNEVSTAILGLLVVIGIINDPTKSNKTSIKTDKEKVVESVLPLKEETENEQKFLENAKNEVKITKNNENLSENLQNSKIFVPEDVKNENLKTDEKVTSDSNNDAETESAKVENKDTENKIPTDNENEISNVSFQTGLQVDEVDSKTQVLKIVN